MPAPVRVVASPIALEALRAFEGLRLEAYRDAVGVWTIGYGHAGAVPGQRITREEADRILLEDVARFESGLRRALLVRLNQDQWDALVLFVFNVGLVAFRNSTLLRMVNARDFAGAQQQFARWTYATRGGQKVQLPGLVRRRRFEAALFASDYATASRVLLEMGQHGLAARIGGLEKTARLVEVGA